MGLRVLGSRVVGLGWALVGVALVGVVVFGAMAGLATVARAVPPPDPLAPCEDQLATDPEAYEPHLCFYRVALGATAEVGERARQRLETRRRQAPDLGWASLVLGNFAFRSGDTDLALERYGEAIDRLGRRGEDYGQVLAMSNRRHTLLRRGDSEAAAQQVAAALEVAQTTNDPIARAQAWSLEARHRLDTVEDLGSAYRALHKASAEAFPEGPFGLQRTLLFLLANLAYHLGRYDEALDAHTRLEALLLTEGSPQGRAINAFNAANVRQAKLEIAPNPEGLAELVAQVRHALQLAETLDEPALAGRCHALLAQLIAQDDPEAARRHLRACHSLAETHGLAPIAASCWWSQAQTSPDSDPAADLEAAERALEAADSTDNDLYRAHAWRARLRAAWQALPIEQANREAERALGAIETLRNNQRDAGHRAQVVANWTADYTWLAGRRLENGDLAGGFDTLERLRARVLHERLAHPAPGDSEPEPPPEAAPGDPSTASTEAGPLVSVRHRLARVHRRLLDPNLDAAARRHHLETLERLEIEERSHLDLAHPMPPRIGLEQATQALAPHEALLVFQLDQQTDLFGQPAGGSWVLVSTQQRSHVVRLPDRARIAPGLPVLHGLIERRDGTESTAARELYEQLLAPALAELPATVTHLVLVPDDLLHRLPFALLETPEGPLGTRYDLVISPSASLWHRWRHQPVEPAEEVALVLADPTLATGSEHTAETRNAVLLGGLRLGALPESRREGRAIRRHLGARLLAGEAASEAWLKQEPLGRYGVVHFATHALADLERPERSSLLLAPGEDDEDGLLRAPEISDLDLSGRIVTLSACQTSEGALIRGEGVMSLARAFFEAGAHTVIGSRWPLRDTDAAVFFDHFYRHLATGETAAAALRRARTDTRAAGLPAEAWAGPVLLGRGDVTLAARPASRWTRWAVILAVSVTLLAILLAVVIRARRASHSA